MLKLLPVFGLFLACAGSALAQVKLEILLDQRHYLLKEPLEVGIRLVNQSGQTLTIPGTNWLSLTVEDRDKFVVKTLNELPSPQPVTVESTFMATQWIDIGDVFDFRENMSYKLNARVRIEQWGEEVYSQPVNFEIIKGTVLWQQQFGVPSEAGSPPQMRKYILQQANYLDELQLYVRVTDLTERVIFEARRLAPMLLISQPEAQIDSLNRLHVLVQFGMRQFMHLCINPFGEIVTRNTYEVSGVRPMLKTTDAGGVFVKGGQRMLRQDDIPPSSLLNQPLPPRPEAPVEDSKVEVVPGVDEKGSPADGSKAGEKPTR